MESIYQLENRAAEIAARYDEIQTEFEALMEENGGELNEESQEYIDRLAELEAMKAELVEEFMKFPDEYAAWYKNEEAAKKMAEAEMKAFEDMQKKAIAKYKAKVSRREARMEWIKQNIAEAMRLADVDRLDKKSRPNALFSIYFQESKSIEVDEVMALSDYEDEIRAITEKCPEWLSFVPKIDKNILKKEEVLPRGFERKTSRNLQIR